MIVRFKFIKTRVILSYSKHGTIYNVKTLSLNWNKMTQLSFKKLNYPHKTEVNSLYGTIKYQTNYSKTGYRYPQPVAIYFTMKKHRRFLMTCQVFAYHVTRNKAKNNNTKMMDRTKYVNIFTHSWTNWCIHYDQHFCIEYIPL